MRDFLLIVSGGVLTGNLVLRSALGAGFLPEGRNKMKMAVNEAQTAIVAVSLTALVTALADIFFLRAYEAEYLRAAVSLLAGYLLLKAGERFAGLRCRETLLPLAMAAALIARDADFPPLLSFGYGLGAGFGAAAVLILTAGMMDRLDLAAVPRGLKPVPFFFVLLGFLSLVFWGFQELAILNR